jgi:hypothetical protein
LLRKLKKLTKTFIYPSCIDIHNLQTGLLFTMSLTSNWLPFNKAIKTINFPNPLQANKAIMADWQRGHLHLISGSALMASSPTRHLLGGDIDAQIGSLVDGLKSISSDTSLHELSQTHLDKLGDGLNHLAVTGVNMPMLFTGAAAVIVGAGFALRGQLRLLAQSNKMTSKGAITLLEELFPKKTKTLINKVV